MINYFKFYYFKFKHRHARIPADSYNEPAAKELKNTIEEINTDHILGIRTWEVLRQNLRECLLNSNLADFINWKVIQDTMFFEAPLVEYEEVINSRIFGEAINESNIGNPKPYYLNSKTSGTLIHHAYSLLQLLKIVSLNEIKSITELGGGYGSMCRLIRNLGYKENYTIFDFPELLALQKYFLSSVDEKFLQNTFFIDDIAHLTPQEKGSCLIATWSLSESPLELREVFLKSQSFDYYLIAFQKEIDNIDNIKFFDDVAEILSDTHTCKTYPISHLHGNYYFLAYKNQL